MEGEQPKQPPSTRQEISKNPDSQADSKNQNPRTLGRRGFLKGAIALGTATLTGIGAGYVITRSGGTTDNDRIRFSAERSGKPTDQTASPTPENPTPTQPLSKTEEPQNLENPKPQRKIPEYTQEEREAFIERLLGAVYKAKNAVVIDAEVSPEKTNMVGEFHAVSPEDNSDLTKPALEYLFRQKDENGVEFVDKCIYLQKIFEQRYREYNHDWEYKGRVCIHFDREKFNADPSSVWEVIGPVAHNEDGSTYPNRDGKRTAFYSVKMPLEEMRQAPISPEDMTLEIDGVFLNYLDSYNRKKDKIVAPAGSISLRIANVYTDWGLPNKDGRVGTYMLTTNIDTAIELIENSEKGTSIVRILRNTYPEKGLNVVIAGLQLEENTPNEGTFSMIEAIGINIPDDELSTKYREYLKNYSPVVAYQKMLKDRVYTEGLAATATGLQEAPGGGLCATATCFIEALGRSLTLAVADEIFEMGQGKISMKEAIKLADDYLHKDNKFLPKPYNHEERYQPARSENVAPRRYEDGTLFARVVRDKDGRVRIIKQGSKDYNPTIPPGIKIKPDFQVGFIKTELTNPGADNNIVLSAIRIGVGIDNPENIQKIVSKYLKKRGN